MSATRYDEDITCSDMTIRHDVCSMSFSEIYSWIKKSVKHTWKAWRTKEVDWGSILCIMTFPIRLSRHIGPRKERDQIQHVLESLDSDCRKVLTCDGLHDFIRTPFCVFKYLIESLSSLLSDGSRLTLVPVQMRPQSSIYYRDPFCPRCCVTLFWAKGPCIKLGPLGARPRVVGRPQPRPGRPPPSFIPP